MHADHTACAFSYPAHFRLNGLTYLRTQIVPNPSPITIAAGIGKSAFKTTPSTRLRRGALFKLQ